MCWYNYETHLTYAAKEVQGLPCRSVIDCRAFAKKCQTVKQLEDGKPWLVDGKYHRATFTGNADVGKGIAALMLYFRSSV